MRQKAQKSVQHLLRCCRALETPTWLWQIQCRDCGKNTAFWVTDLEGYTAEFQITLDICFQAVEFLTNSPLDMDLYLTAPEKD